MGAVGYGVGRLGATETLPNVVLYIERSLAAVGVALVALAAKKLVAKLLTDKVTCTLAAIAVVLVINFSATAWLIPVIMLCGGIVTYLEAEVPGWVDAWREARKKRDVEVARGGESGGDVLVEDSGAAAAVSSTVVPEPGATTPVAAPREKDLRIYFSYSITTGFILIGLYVGLLILSAIIRSLNLNTPLNVLSMFYFVGAIIFGGGPVVVPLLYSYVVTSTAWLTSTEFLMGFAVINCMPGPNFNFAAFCGALAFRDNGWTSLAGALLAWIGIFLPGLLIKAGILPIWRHYRDLKAMKRVFRGLNSVAVGLLVAAVFLLWQKAIAVGGVGGGVVSLGTYPSWTGVMVLAFLAMDVYGISGPWVVLAGAVVGAIGWAADGRP
ncbi:chromate transporter-domain-containing protein [Chytriomyces sp. MP71]|nr:chromate transporter-domain-containing protein [Chytriomyces sp. MP71]